MMQGKGPKGPSREAKLFNSQISVQGSQRNARFLLLDKVSLEVGQGTLLLPSDILELT